MTCPSPAIPASGAHDEDASDGPLSASQIKIQIVRVDGAGSGERESDRFEVDNTPPVVENLKEASASPEVRVRFDARDSYSALARAEYSLDAGEWKLILPVDRITDAPGRDEGRRVGAVRRRVADV